MCFAWKVCSLLSVMLNSWDKLRSLQRNLTSVCSLVWCFRRSSLIVFKYCEHFTLGKACITRLNCVENSER